jgi:cell division protein FtsB
MASRTPVDRRNNFVKRRRSRASLVLALAGRIAVAIAAALVFALAGVQFARVIGQNVALARELSRTNAEIASLEARHALQLQKMRRLESPEGAIPEIHDRLRLVRPNEAIIFVSPAPASSSAKTPRE